MKILVLLLLAMLGQSCSHVFYQPAPKHFYHPSQFKLKFEDLYFSSKDGTKLNGWFFPAKSGKAKGTIVQFHGNGENISTHFYSLIWLVDHGYNLFTFDYRGYAKSEGEPNQAGIYQDALSALDKAWELNEKNGNGKFIVYGQSTGGAISLRALPDWHRYDKVSLTVMDSAFSSYQDIAFDKMRNVWLLWPISPLAFLLVSDKYAADDVFDRITRPTLVIVGMKDKIVPNKFGKVIYKGIKAKEKWLWKLPQGNHIDAYHHAENIYRRKFLDFVDQNAQ